MGKSMILGVAQEQLAESQPSADLSMESKM